MATSKQVRRFQRRPQLNTEPSMTKQSFKDEVNINNIMAKFQKSGAITHYAAHAPTYGDATGIELLDAQMIIINAQDMFDDLPSSIRKKFDNDPAKFLDFVQDENNHDEMVKLGLKETPIPIVQPIETDKKHPDLPSDDQPKDKGKPPPNPAD